MAAQPVVLHSPTRRRDGDAVRVSWRADDFAPAADLWYSVPAEFEEALGLANADAYVLGVLSRAMETGQDIVIRGSLSEKLFYNLTRYYMPMLSIVRPSLRPVGILPDELAVRQGPSRNGVGAGISGGIDSFSMLADHLGDTVPPGYRVTHLVMSNVGSHGPPGASRPRFLMRRARLGRLAAELHLPFVSVDSNMEDIVPGRFIRSHTLRTLSAAHVLQEFLGTYLFASSYGYADSHADPHPDVAVIDPMAVHLLSTEATACVLVGAQHSRVEKTRRVADFPPSYEYLDVCINPDISQIADRPNCSSCYKCGRTMLTLELLGRLDRYGAVFDLDYWRMHRTRLIAKVLSRRVSRRRSKLVKEVIDLATEQGIRLPVTAQVLGEGRGLLVSGAQSRVGRQIKRIGRRHLAGHAPARGEGGGGGLT